MTTKLNDITINCKSISLTNVQKFSSNEIPGGRGTRMISMERGASEILLDCYEDGAFEDNVYDKLKRAKDIGDSVKLDIEDEAITIGFITNITLSRDLPDFRSYTIDLIEAYHKIINVCDLTDSWSVDSGGGALSVDSTYLKEGSGSLKLSGTISASTPSRMKYNPSSLIDLEDYGWVVFWFRISNKDNISSAYIKLFKDGSNYASYDFSSLLTQVNRWIKVRVKKSSFSETGTMDWGEIDYITIDVTKSVEAAYDFYVDDLGAME
ncbi:MAG: hypothetical protein HXX80_01750 [Nitrososphaerales archaeon]|nr:hypothetical protein [Nitrososphaerales archaeon]